MDVLLHKSFGCSSVYDKYFLRWNKSGSFGAKIGQNLDERVGFGAKNGQNLDFSAELARMQLYSRVKGIELIKLNGENSGARYYLLQVL